jgi:threonine synthase
MDVGNPSNMERLRHLMPDFAELRSSIQSYPVDDVAIRTQIAQDFERFGVAWCPHTATGFYAYDHLSAVEKRASAWSVCATAHAAKFDTIVEPIVGSVDVPPALAEILKLPARCELLQPEIDALRTALTAWHE